MRAAALLFIAVLLVGPPAMAAESVSATMLLETPQSFDGHEVTVVGELIGDYGYRDDGTVWTQLNDDPYAFSPLRDGGRLLGGNVGIGIHAAADLFDGIDPPGRYNRVGPLVIVTGTWRYHDPDRGGETYLEVASLQTVRAGYPLSEPVSPTTLVAAAVLVLAAASALLLARRR
jgi:hypothetical protein